MLWEIITTTEELSRKTFSWVGTVLLPMVGQMACLRRRRTRWHRVGCYPSLNFGQQCLTLKFFMNCIIWCVFLLEETMKNSSFTEVLPKHSYYREIICSRITFHFNPEQKLKPLGLVSFKISTNKFQSWNIGKRAVFIRNFIS